MNTINNKIMFYKFDQASLVWKKDWKRFKFTIITVSILLTLSYGAGRYSALIDNEKMVWNDMGTIPIGSQPWVDSTFAKYERDSRRYLSQKKYKNIPIKPEMLRLAAYNAYDSTGILLPVEFALAQAEIESSMGTKGRSPVNNPFNIMEYDNRTGKYFHNTFDGIQAYYYLMCNNYLKCKSVDILFKNFTNCSGRRYATSIDYERAVSSQYSRIVKFLKK